MTLDPRLSADDQGQIANETGQLAGIRLEMAEGDYVITPAADRESLRYGRITGPCVGVHLPL